MASGVAAARLPLDEEFLDLRAINAAVPIHIRSHITGLPRYEECCDVVASGAAILVEITRAGRPRVIELEREFIRPRPAKNSRSAGDGVEPPGNRVVAWLEHTLGGTVDLSADTWLAPFDIRAGIAVPDSHLGPTAE